LLRNVTPPPGLIGFLEVEEEEEEEEEREDENDEVLMTDGP
jgi:hypothetical protein